MADHHIKNGADVGTRAVIERLPDIGDVSHVDLLPKPHQRVVVQGTRGSITFDTQGATFFGQYSGSGGADQIADIFRKLGWPYRDHRMFRQLSPDHVYRVTPEEILEIARAIPAGEVAHHF